MKQEKSTYFLFKNRYIEIFANDPRIDIYHKSLYETLFHYWNLSYFRKIFQNDRATLVKHSKVMHPRTYKKTFEDLQNWGYLLFIPGKSKVKPLEVFMKTFTADELELIINTGRKEITEFENLNSKKKRIVNDFQFYDSTTSNMKRLEYSKYVLTTSQMKWLFPETISDMNRLNDETISNMKGLNDSTISLMTDNHFINEDIYTTTTNYSTLLNIINQKINNNDLDEKERKKVAQKKESNVPPNLSEILEFFISNNYSEQLANKFYEHYSKRQWCYNDSIKITDWKIPANYWINNSKADTKQNINYDEKL